LGFKEKILKAAKEDKQRVVLPEADDIRTLQAAAEIIREGIADVTLLGDQAAIEKLGHGLDLSGARVVDWRTDARQEGYQDTFYELRKAKGVSREDAAKAMADPLAFGVMMVKKGEVDGMVAGACHSTASTLRPALQILKTAPGTKLVSSFFVIVVPDCQYGNAGTFLFTDCGLIENPTAEELSEIAIGGAASYRTFVGGEPVVAMLSYSSYGSAKSEMTQKVAEATRLAKEKAPGLALDGELQLDAAIVEAVGASKAPGSKVAGHANVLVFPDLNAGNIGYKIAQRLGQAEAYGPILQGIAAPVNDLSRGCSWEDIVVVAAFTSVQAQSLKRSKS
jgi:phosphate acetyltransferase